MNTQQAPTTSNAGPDQSTCWLAWAAGRRRGAVFSGFYHADFRDSYVAPALSRLPRAISRPIVEGSRRYARFVYGRFDVTCVASRHVERKLRAYGVRNTFLVPLGVDAVRFRPELRDEGLRRKLGVAAGEKLLLYVGRFGGEKGIDVLIAALARLARRPGLHLVFVGDGPVEPRLAAAAKAHRRSRLLGCISDTDRLARLYASADLFLAPGPYETFGLTALEAFGSGIPVLAADRGGAGELVTASGAGMLFAAHDVDDFVRRVDELLAADLPALGRRARRFVADGYSWNRTFGLLVDRYARLCHARRTGHPVAA